MEPVGRRKRSFRRGRDSRSALRAGRRSARSRRAGDFAASAWPTVTEPRGPAKNFARVVSAHEVYSDSRRLDFRSSGLLDSLDVDLVHGDRRARTIAGIARHLGDLLSDVLAFDDLAKDGVLVVKPGGSRDGDEELASIGARTGVGHGEFACLRVLERGMKFVAESVTRSTAAAALRAAALDHKIGNHAVKHQAVVVFAALFLAGTRVFVFLGALS